MKLMPRSTEPSGAMLGVLGVDETWSGELLEELALLPAVNGWAADVDVAAGLPLGRALLVSPASWAVVVAKRTDEEGGSKSVAMVRGILT